MKIFYNIFKRDINQIYESPKESFKKYRTEGNISKERNFKNYCWIMERRNNFV